MVTQRRAIVLLLLLPLALWASCDKVPLLAPTGTVINLFPATTSVSLNSEVTIIATVIENGVAVGGSGGAPTGGSTSRSGNGTPVQNGTVVSFTTTIGRIEPADARTTNGQVNVRLITGNVSGTATITAYSGGASSQTSLLVGTAAVETLLVNVTPATLGSAGGSVVVTGTALDKGGSPIGGVTLLFSTDSGVVSPASAVTDASGTATTTLTTTATAKVTAKAAGKTSNEATVTVNPFTLAKFTATPSTTNTGIPVVFTVDINEKAAAVSNLRIEYGDGSRDDLGPINGSATAVHVYRSSGVFTAKATAIEAAGGSSALTTTVVVGSLPVTLTPDKPKPLVGEPVTFTVGGLGTAPIDHFIWTFDDGTPEIRTTSPTLPHTFSTKGVKNVRVDVFGVGGGQIGSAAAQVDVQ